MLPIPRNLKGILVTKGAGNNEFKVSGELKCPCGAEGFGIHFVGNYQKGGTIKVLGINNGFFLIIKAECGDCQETYELFDKDYNGWNGFVSEGFGGREHPRPKTRKWECPRCLSGTHRINVTIFSKGQQDFVQETGGEFKKEDWAEAYSWITFGIKCLSCEWADKKWIDYETM